MNRKDGYMLVGMNKRVHPEKWPIAAHIQDLEASAIREILKFTSQPGVISFAGGLPAPELFPIEDIKRVACEVLDKYKAASVQYSLSRGITPLRELIAQRAVERGTPTNPDNIIITSGSQQAIELLGSAFIEPGDYIITENPTYVGAMQTFNYYRAQYITVEMDDDGMIVDGLSKKIEKYHPKLIYCVPNFQNPTGRTLSLERREQLLEMAVSYDIPVIDDNPYGDIQFSGESLPSVKSLGGDEVIALRTFSKLLAPGLRIGWINGPKSIVDQFEKVKQCFDLHTNTFAQYIVYEYVKQGLLEPHVENIKTDYRKKRDVMLKTMKEKFPPGITWTHPDGGLFLWVELPSHMDAKKLMPKAVALKVAYVPGESCFPNGGGQNTLRLNFSNATHEGIVEGITRLGNLFADNM